MIKYVIQYDPNTSSFDEVNHFADVIENCYPEEKIIFIPQIYAFNTFSKDQLIALRENLNKVIEEM